MPGATLGEPANVRARTNEEWSIALADPGPRGETTRAELRGLIVTGLRKVLASRGVSADHCEDFAQEALLKVREKLASFRGESRFVTWALAIATRVAFDELRHRRWKDVSFETITADAQSPVHFEMHVEATQERDVLRARVVERLGQVIETELTEKQRAVLFAELQGMPHAEIAPAMGMNRNALYKLAHDARKKVKHGLEAAGLTDSDILWLLEH